MDRLCHRCGSPLREDDNFCAHCGAAQLLVDAADSGLPQQGTGKLRGDANVIQWRIAMTSALMVAVPVGLLSAFAGTSTLFVIAGGFATIALYRRRGGASADGRTGWRVGAILGAVSAFLATAAYAARMLVERYLMHDGQAIDQEFQTAAQQGIEYWLKAGAQQGPQPSEMAHAMKTVTGFLLSPDGHAALQLSTAVMMSLDMLLFAAVGGAIGGWIQSTRTRVQRSL